MKYRLESGYLWIFNENKCKDILSKTNKDEKDMIDFLISLHLVLEIKLNTFFRQVLLLQTKLIVASGVDEFKIIKNIDNISFIDKIIFLIYNSDTRNAQFDDVLKYHKIINEVKRFSELRNKLLHGHSVSYSGTDKDGKIIKSDVSRNINLKYLKEQIERFVFIIDGINFYFDYYESNSIKDKDNLKKNYLNYAFLLNAKGEVIDF